MGALNTKQLSIAQLIMTSFTIGMYLALMIGYFYDPIGSWHVWPSIGHNLTISSLLLMPFFITILGMVQITYLTKDGDKTKLSRSAAISALFSYIPFAVLMPFTLNVINIFTKNGGEG